MSLMGAVAYPQHALRSQRRPGADRDGREAPPRGRGRPVAMAGTALPLVRKLDRFDVGVGGRGDRAPGRSVDRDEARPERRISGKYWLSCALAGTAGSAGCFAPARTATPWVRSAAQTPSGSLFVSEPLARCRTPLPDDG